MFKTRSFSFALLGTLLLAGLVGCESTAASKSDAMTAPTRAIVISGGQSGGTAVLIPTADNDDVVTLSGGSSATMCAQCKADAIKYFKTGELVAKCSVCGATRTPVTLASPAVGHQ